MVYAYTYRAYWREQGSTNWNEITSSSPITWIHETTTSGPTWTPPDVMHTGPFTVRFRQIRSTNTNPRQYFYSPQTFSGSNGPVRIVRNNGANACSPIPGHPSMSWMDTTIRFGQNFANAVSIQSLCSPIYGAIIDGIDLSNGTTVAPPGNSCKTTFSTGLVVTRSQCVEVTTKIPECPCCGPLLPRANAILARL